MRRKQFIQSQGATCANWTWSWSFINEAKKIVIFGAWDLHNDGKRCKILDESWKINPKGRKSPSYPQSREHVRLIEEEGYRLMTFAMKYSDANRGEDGLGPAKIDEIVPELKRKTLTRVGSAWYASDGRLANALPEELAEPAKYPEGAQVRVTVNAFERNAKARSACIAHHGAVCAVCRIRFEEVYGDLGSGFIHVHHRIPIGSVGSEYQVNPIKDLVPVCPNCHAMIHRAEPQLTVDQLQALIEEVRGRKRR